MSPRKLMILLLLVNTLPSASFSQEMLGLTGSTYSGTNSLMLNPACLINSRAYIEVNLLTAGISFDNNYLYLAKGEYKLGELFSKDYQTVDYKMTPDKLTIYDRYNEDIKHAFVNFRATGPSLMLSWSDIAFAYTTTARTALSIHNVPFHIAKFSYEGVDYPPQQDIDYSASDFDLAHMSWMETGLSMAYRVYKKGNDQLSLGISAKRLFGFTGIYLLGNGVDYMVPDDSTLIVYEIDAEAGISVPLERDTNKVSLDPNFFRGRGWGFDFGLVYQRNKKSSPKGKGKTSGAMCSGKFEEYDFRIGLSLLDVGNIKYTQQADRWRFDHVGTYWPMVNKTNYPNIAAAAGDLGYRFYNDSAAARVDNMFTLYLPTAVSVQFDYHFSDGFYLNTVFLHPLRTTMPGIRRPAQLAAVPRYESRYFGVDLPFSIYDFRYPRLGLSLRAFFLTVGTDRLGSFLGWSDFTGMDAYLSLKLSFNKGYCKKKKVTHRCGNAEFRRHL